MDADAQLMVRVRDGDDGAFNALMTRYRKPVINFVYRLVQNGSAAEEIAQDVFVNIYLARHRYEPTARFSTWLFTVATNMSLKHLKRKKRWISESEADPEAGRTYAAHPEGNPSALDRVVDRELADLVREAVRNLPEKERTAIVLCKYHDFSYQEIAQIMKCSLGAIKTHIHRGKLRLRDMLRKMGLAVEGPAAEREV
ncbi:MAG: sigma-70 family RNA polymerase sigma factor [Acidobacteria bacterium]|nr:sigma-70 family RNA polymerase sigma factor [Acidobacteriota bacterium]